MKTASFIFTLCLHLFTFNCIAQNSLSDDEMSEKLILVSSMYSSNDVDTVIERERIIIKQLDNTLYVYIYDFSGPWVVARINQLNNGNRLEEFYSISIEEHGICFGSYCDLINDSCTSIIWPDSLKLPSEYKKLIE